MEEEAPRSLLLGTALISLAFCLFGVFGVSYVLLKLGWEYGPLVGWVIIPIFVGYKSGRSNPTHELYQAIAPGVIILLFGMRAALDSIKDGMESSSGGIAVALLALIPAAGLACGGLIAAVHRRRFERAHNNHAHTDREPKRSPAGGA